MRLKPGTVVGESLKDLPTLSQGCSKAQQTPFRHFASTSINAAREGVESSFLHLPADLVSTLKNRRLGEMAA